MLSKVACIMIYVDDLAESVNFYSDVFGLKPVWQDQNAGQAGLLFPTSETEIVLRTDPDMPGQVEVYYQVEDVSAALMKYVDQGCKVLAAPFDMRMGRGAVLQDPFGIRLCILDMSKAATQANQL